MYVVVPDVGAAERCDGDGVVCSAQSSKVCRSGAGDTVETADSEFQTDRQFIMSHHFACYTLQC